LKEKESAKILIRWKKKSEEGPTALCRNESPQKEDQGKKDSPMPFAKRKERGPAVLSTKLRGKKKKERSVLGLECEARKGGKMGEVYLWKGGGRGVNRHALA